MKKTLITAVALTFAGSLYAQIQQEEKKQDNSTDQNSSVQIQQSGTSTSSSNISEPSGAQTPQGRAYSDDNPPNGRAFSTNNAPQGKPFQDESRPPGRPFQEPSGADSSGSKTNLNSAPKSDSISGALDRSRSSTGQSSASDIKHEAAGAQRNQSQRLATAFQSHEKGQIEEAVKANLGTTVGAKVPDEFVTRLSSDLSTVFTKVQITEEQRVKVANAISIILTAQPANQVEVQQAFTTVQTILVPTGNVTLPLAQAAVCDLHLIATQLIPGFQLELAAPAVRVK